MMVDGRCERACVVVLAPKEVVERRAGTGLASSTTQHPTLLLFPFALNVSALSSTGWTIFRQPQAPLRRTSSTLKALSWHRQALPALRSLALSARPRIASVPGPLRRAYQFIDKA